MELRYKDKVLGGGSGGGSSSPASSGVPTGSMMIWLTATAPDGWAICDGSIFQIEDYQELANLIEQQFGSKNYFGGDGETTFAVPDMSGRFMMGSSTSHAIGQTGGEEEVTLTKEQMPEHNHLYSYDSAGSNAQKAGTTSMFFAPIRNPSTTNNWSTASAGSNQPHNNLPPFMALNYIMKL